MTDPRCYRSDESLAAPGEGACPHTCSSIEANCTRTCEASGDYSQCDLQTPVVRDCVANEELAECLKLSASNRA